MTDILPFPNDIERLRNTASKKMEQEEYLSAKNLFVQLYQLAPSFEHCRKLVEATRLTGDFSLALEYAEDYAENFLTNQESFTDYVHLLVLDAQYLAAHRLLSLTSFPTDELNEELKKVEQAQDWLNEGSLAKFQQLNKWEASMQPIPVIEWRLWEKGFTKNAFSEICRDYLSDAKNPFVVPKLVEALVQLGVTETLVVQGKDVNLSQLKPVEQTTVFQHAMAYLKKQNLKQIQLEEMVLTELNAHFALMYPFLPEEKEVIKWVDSYIIEYQSLFSEEITTSELEHYAKIQAKKQELRLIFQTLL